MAEKLSTPIEFLVALQDLDIMLREIEEVRQLGFDVNTEGAATLNRAREELVQKIKQPFARNYERLRNRYKRAIVPVKEGTCLGCFMRVPTSLPTHGRADTEVYCCENCGRILYWLE